MTNNGPSSILFVCGMNAIRSPMAAAITRHLFPQKVYARSAGVHKGQADPIVKIIMAEIGIDIGEHEPHTYEELDETAFDALITLTKEAFDHVDEYTGDYHPDVQFWEVVDPSVSDGNRDQKLDAYRATRDDILARVKTYFGV